MSLDNFQICDRDLDRATAARYLGADAIAVDTETMGLSIGRDRFVTAVRIEKGQKSAPNLEKVLQAKDVTKVFHFARFDVAQFRYTFGIDTTPIFCTKIASKLARTYTSNHGLKSLVSELLGVELDKTSQSSDWGDIDRLSEQQLSYAANDVRYLLEAKDKLTTILKREERWGLAQKCFQCIPVFTVLDIMHYNNIFEH
jgi:ribonuclease D